MKSIDTYEACLTEFKKSMEDGSEFNLLIEGITKNIPTNRIRWFEVGIGDGHYLKKVVSRLNQIGFVVELSGVDPSEESVKKARKLFPGRPIIVQDFLDLELEGKYDVFSFNQSIYYFHSKQQVVDKCIRHLSEGGLIANVCWSEKDSIYKFHKKVFGEWTLGAFSSENFAKMFDARGNMNVVFSDKFKGYVNFGLWKNKKSLLKNLRVISRIPLAKNVSASNYQDAENILSEFKDRSIRVNGVVVAKKSYDIEKLKKGGMISELKKRFPHYQNLVPRIEGDPEALFMSSWEKETEYLASQVKKGARVLEICSAAGLKSVILAKDHKVVAIDINEKRLEAARNNAALFGVDSNINILKIDASKKSELKSLGDFDAIYVDVDWREDLKHPIKKQNIDPFATSPRTDILYKNLREPYPDAPIIFKVSPFVRIMKMVELAPCVIEELFIDDKFLSYNVYYDKSITKSRWQQIRLFNEDRIKL